MNQTHLFPSIIIEEKTYEIDNEKISKVILEREKTTSTRKISNSGGWQSELYPGPDTNPYVNFIGRGWAGIPVLEDDDAIIEIIDFANKTFKEIYKEYYTEEGSFYIDTFWLNVNRYRDFNYNHNHGGHDWSFIYYIKIPVDCGNVVFVDPRIRRMGRQGLLAKNIKDNYFSHDQFYVPAEEGLIVFFPSYLEHYVQPNETKKPRISLSGNINLKI